jgi:CheY-like chemotaxis protein
MLDISLPGLNGLELQKRIAVKRTDMPIIFITGYGDVPKTVQAMKAGAIEFLTKPFNDEVLLNGHPASPGKKPPGTHSGDGDSGTQEPLRLAYSPRTGGYGVGRLRAAK